MCGNETKGDQIVKITNWSVTTMAGPYQAPEQATRHLVGNVMNHPGYAPGTGIRTSNIVKAEGNIITTNSGTVYELGMIDPEYLEWMKSEGLELDPEQPIKVTNVNINFVIKPDPPVRNIEMEVKFITTCYDCGKVYGKDDWIEAIIPDKVWEEINPSEHKGGGILCIACIAKRLIKAGYGREGRGNVPVWLCGTEPFLTMPGQIDSLGQIAILRNWEIK